MKRKLIICGTGHRPDKIGGYSDEAFNKLVNVAMEWLSLHQPTLTITGLAMGWDMALAQACINLNLPFLSAVPFKGQERLWQQKTKDYYNYLLSKSAKVVIVSEGGYSPAKMQIRNEFMVKHSDLVLALWDGSDGGTHNCIKYAKKKLKTIINLYDKL